MLRRSSHASELGLLFRIALATCGLLACAEDVGSAAFHARRDGGPRGRGSHRDAGASDGGSPMLDGGAPAFDAGITDAGASNDAGAPAACCNARELGSLPNDLSGLVWPALPVIAQEIAVTTDAALSDALSTRGNVRILVSGSHAGAYYVMHSDVEIVLAPDAFIENLYIWRGQRRVHVRGGTFRTIEMAVPTEYWGGAYDPALMASDITVECVTVSAPGTAFLVRGSRVAILGADVTAELYSLFAGDTGSIPIEDLIVAHSVFRSAGTQATFRIHDTVRSVVAYTTLSNTLKHNYRVHGHSERNYIGDSVLVGTGVMMAREAGDLLDRISFVRNVLHYDGSTGLFIIDETRITRLTVTDNVAFSGEPFVVPSLPGWEIGRNETYPYQPPPSSVFSCR